MHHSDTGISAGSRKPATNSAPIVILMSIAFVVAIVMGSLSATVFCIRFGLIR